MSFEQMTAAEFRRHLAAGRTEDEEQAALIAWADSAEDERAHRLLHIPNGGHRLKAVAARLKALGVRPGVPDLLLPVRSEGPGEEDWHPRRHYPALWIELKRASGVPSDLLAHQRAWLLALRGEGFAAEVAFGAEAAREIISAYLAGSYRPAPLP